MQCEQIVTFSATGKALPGNDTDSGHSEADEPRHLESGVPNSLSGYHLPNHREIRRRHDRNLRLLLLSPNGRTNP